MTVLVRSLFFAAVAVVSQVTVTSSTSAAPYELRGFRLGVSLSDFRTTPFPENKYLGVLVVCTGDRTPGISAFAVELFDGEAKTGMIRCAHYGRDPDIPGTHKIFMSIGTDGGNATFDFFPDSESGGTYRLFRINVASNMDYWDNFFAAYNEKFGKPTTLITGKVQNGTGSYFDKITASWSSKDSSIVLEQRVGRIDFMEISYLLFDIDKQFEMRLQKINGKPSDKL